MIGGAPLVVSHDLHGNLTRARVETADALVAYQTNPTATTRGSATRRGGA